jgi:hypothetical protein
MKKLLMTTALVMMTAGPMAAQTTAPMTGMSYTANDMELSVDNMLDMNVYVRGDATAATEMDWTMGWDDAPDGWEDLGDVGDILLNKDGQVDSITLDTGGFLGMGVRHTRIAMDQLQFVRDTNDDGEFFIVYTGDRAAIEGTDAYDAETVRNEGYMSTREMRLGNANTTTGVVAVVPAERQEMYGYARDNRETWVQEDWSAMTTEDLTGVQVNGSGDNWVGEISELVLGDDGKISHAIIDVGGWLGIGERPVAIPFDQIELRRNADDNSVVAYVDATEDALEAMPEWEG